MTASKSSQTTRNIVIAILAIWSIISIIIIAVWATSADMKSASKCRAELKELQEKHEGAKVVWTKDRKALEDLVRQGWKNQSVLQKQIEQQKEQMRFLNLSLEASQQENIILNGNITDLKGKIEAYTVMVGNLSAEISLQKDHIEGLEHNLTLKAQELDSCAALQTAAAQLQNAAEKQHKACETSKQFLQKQLAKCKNTDVLEETAHHVEVNPDNGVKSITASSVTLAMILCLSLLLVP
ncbi:uncharacterized protein si:ch211-1a19.3 [Triplophysa dalaica]|uniref:uncharacterized protein si:ch211-1a19.3 n=1 Tax=Triplophysa dalaica TaxID=1582913 RepID=UPI0024DFF4EC|nr:uncharacterized protein si:ch211-1a19.3 [Triplophysa dalaica]